LLAAPFLFLTFSPFWLDCQPLLLAVPFLFFDYQPILAGRKSAHFGWQRENINNISPFWLGKPKNECSLNNLTLGFSLGLRSLAAALAKSP
jgi:hypothetical protein